MPGLKRLSWGNPPHRYTVLQVHQSKVASLLFVSAGTVLCTGCDAAAPRLDAGGDDPPLALIDPQVGRRLLFLSACAAWSVS